MTPHLRVTADPVREDLLPSVHLRTQLFIFGHTGAGYGLGVPALRTTATSRLTTPRTTTPRAVPLGTTTACSLAEPGHPTHVYRCSAALAQHAWHLARDVLGHDQDRWVHTCAVVARAGEGAGVLPPQQRALLLAAAWLHDIGYAPSVQQTLETTRVGSQAFHPLDGAHYLTIHGWPVAVAALVAHHSGAVHVAEALGQAEQVRAYPIAPELQAVAEALTWADQTTGPAGQPWSMPERVSEMLHRLGPKSPNARAHPHRLPDVIQAVERTEQRRRDLI